METVGSYFAPERGAAVDQGNGFGHIAILVVSKHAALHPFMKHLHFTLETKPRESQISIRVTIIHDLHSFTPVRTCTGSLPGRSGCTEPLWSPDYCWWRRNVPDPPAASEIANTALCLSQCKWHRTWWWRKGFKLTGQFLLRQTAATCLFHISRNTVSQQRFHSAEPSFMSNIRLIGETSAAGFSLQTFITVKLTFNTMWRLFSEL